MQIYGTHMLFDSLIGLSQLLKGMFESSVFGCGISSFHAIKRYYHIPKICVPKYGSVATACKHIQIYAHICKGLKRLEK